MLYLYEDSIISDLTKYAIKDKSLQQIILFGSFVRNEHQPDSDIDVLIVTNNISETNQLFSKYRDTVYINTSVVISFHYITPLAYANTKDPFLNQIKKEGKIIWSTNKKI